MKALRLIAGPRALAHLRQHGLQPADVRMIPAAAGGPKGLILGPLDRFLFGEWLAAASHPVHLVGASIGAWRMAAAASPDPARALAEMAEAYIGQSYRIPRFHRKPTAGTVSEGFGAMLESFLSGRTESILRNARYPLHVFTSRGRHILGRENLLLTPLGYGGAVAANAIDRRGLGAFLERVVFSTPGTLFPLSLEGLPHRRVQLARENLLPAIQASCSIPFVLKAVHDIPGGPSGAYWDGGITDYHLHLDYRALPGVVLYPHFQQTVIPGWLDKPHLRRHAPTAGLDNVLLLAPRPDWVASLPNGKLPDRADFAHYGLDLSARTAAWRQAVGEARRLADEFAAWLQDPDPNAVEAMSDFRENTQFSPRKWGLRERNRTASTPNPSPPQ